MHLPCLLGHPDEYTSSIERGEEYIALAQCQLAGRAPPRAEIFDASVAVLEDAAKRPLRGRGGRRREVHVPVVHLEIDARKVRGHEIARAWLAGVRLLSRDTSHVVGVIQ